jgi:hypothetical protein
MNPTQTIRNMRSGRGELGKKRRDEREEREEGNDAHFSEGVRLRKERERVEQEDERAPEDA